MELPEPDVPAEGKLPTETPRSRRLLWWGMLGLGALLLCGLVAIAGTTWYRGQLQQSHVAALLQWDSGVYASYREYIYTPPPVYRFGIVSGPTRFLSVQGSPSPRLKWLVPILGQHCFVRILKIEIWDERFSDEDVPLVLCFPELRELELRSTRVTDRGVRQLAALERLVALDARDVPLSAETVGRLAVCRELRELRINTSLVEPDVVAELRRKLPDCRIELWSPPSSGMDPNPLPER